MANRCFSCDNGGLKLWIIFFSTTQLMEDIGFRKNSSDVFYYMKTTDPTNIRNRRIPGNGKVQNYNHGIANLSW